MLGVGKVGQVVSLVGEVKREVLVSFLPDITNLLAALNDEVVHAKCLAPGGRRQSAVIVLTPAIEAKESALFTDF